MRRIRRRRPRVRLRTAGGSSRQQLLLPPRAPVDLALAKKLVVAGVRVFFFEIIFHDFFYFACGPHKNLHVCVIRMEKSLSLHTF